MIDTILIWIDDFRLMLLHPNPATFRRLAERAQGKVNSGLALAGHFGDGRLRANDLAAGLTGAVIKDPVHDAVAWQEYLETVAKERAGWDALYRACREMV